MASGVTVYGADALDFITNSRRPKFVSKTGRDISGLVANAAQNWDALLHDDDVVVTNSILDKREWAALDSTVLQMVRLRLNMVEDLRSRGLVRTTTLAEMLSQWRVASEQVIATANMDGRSQVRLDRSDKKTYGTPVPIIAAEYHIGRRELLASRTLGADIDTFEAGEAGVAVAEKAESIMVDGDAAVVVNGNAVVGYTSVSGRDTATAAAYGGGDFGTITNIAPTFLGMISALSAKRYHGPFVAYVYPSQYIEMLATYTDGSGQSALQRVLALPQIAEVKPADYLVTGEAVLVQMTSNVVDLVIGMDVENREWESGDGMELMFKVMMALAPRIKTDFAGYVGVAHATSC
jgi:uncharacterized linocin/CFP29 family protein